MAGARGVPFAIYRPCFISGSPQSGAGNPTDFLNRFISACLQLGCAPEIDSRINILPVSYMSRAILVLSQHEDVLGRCLNVVNEQSMSLSRISDSLVNWGRSSGFPIEKVSFGNWWSQCNSTEELQSLRFFFPEPAPKSSPPTNVRARVEVEMDSETNRLLQAEGVPRPPITQELMERYITYLAQSQGWNGSAFADNELTTPCSSAD